MPANAPPRSGLMSRTYLVTGGAGFIGGHLVDALLADGHRVRVVDDLSTGSLDNLRRHEGDPSLEVTVGSVCDRRLLEPLADGADAIFHLAAVVGVGRVMESPIATIETGTRGMDVVMNIAARRMVPMLFTSTSEVYGKSADLPLQEDGDLLFGPTFRGRWSYACAKALDEYLALAFHREKGVPVTIARLFNTVGPRQSPRFGMVLPRFVGRALRGEPLPVYGDGSHTRCFTSVHDVVWALRRLMDCEAARGQVFNVGSTEAISILDLAHLVKSHLRSHSAIRFVPYAEAFDEDFEESIDRLPDLSRVQAMIGYRPRRTLLQTIDDIVEHGIDD